MRMWMNSKFIEKGDYFLVNDKNKKYVDDAINNGASKIVLENCDKYSVDTLRVNNIYEYLYDNYKDCINDLKFIGITGTNGKTTICYLIYQMLKMLNIKVCYIGTIGFYINDKVYDLDNTTPSMDLLYNMFLYAKKEGIEVVVMEVSSHALKQNRVYGLSYDAIAVTNITKDHLDYHKTIDDYIKQKKRLTNLTRGKKICVLNGYDKYYKKFINKDNNNYIINKDIKINKINQNLYGTYLKFKDDNTYNVKLNLVGKFNVLNFLVAYKIIKELGYDSNYILDNSYLLSEPKGRMQSIKFNNNIIFIDYAHSPDAVLNVLKTVKKIKNKGIITIIGCGGNRDKTKRSIMAKAACKYSKKVIFTNDNPRLENEKDIMNDILKGAKGKYEVVYDRYNAIKEGISLLKDNNILMILGKGHEEYQIIGNKKLHFSDLESVLDIIEIS